MDKFIGQEITGEKFNKLVCELKIDLVKLTNKEEIHYGFKFKNGLNVDKENFNPSGECSKGGIYFTTMTNFHKWIIYSKKLMYWYRKVSIPNNARVYIEDDKFKVNKIVLGKRKYIWNDKNICLAIVKKNGRLLRYVDEQTHEICLAAVQQDGRALPYVMEQTPKICREAVKQNGYALQYVIKQTPKICLEAVKQNGLALRYVRKQTPELYLAATAQCGCELTYISKQGPECIIIPKKYKLILC